MGQTLTNGVYLPDNGERNCYVGLSQNWQKLDNLLGNKGDKVSFSQTLTEGVEIGKITINGVDVSLFHTDYSSDIASKAKASDLTAHTSDTDIHVTTSDKSKWNGKQDALSSQQLSNIADVTNKANDNNVVHKSGNETIVGIKTFTNNIVSTTSVGAPIIKNSFMQIWGLSNTIILRQFDDNGNLIDFTVDKQRDVCLLNGSLGTSTNKWKSLYATSIFGGANNIDCSVDSLGDGYVRYSNGLQICFYQYLANAGANTAITLPKPFINTNYISTLTSCGGEGSCSITPNSTHIAGFSISNAGTNSLFVNVISIGYWK